MPAERGAEQIAAHAGEQDAAERHLALADRCEIGGERHGRPERSARHDARDHAQDEQHREAGRRRAGKGRQGQQKEADSHHPRLAAHVGDRAEHRLQHRIGQRKGGGEQRGGRGLDPETDGDLRNHRVDRAGEQGGREGDQADDVQQAVHECSFSGESQPHP